MTDLKIGGAMIVIFFASFFYPSEAASTEIHVCKSFSFAMKKEDWLLARKTMHDISIDSKGNPPFIDESYEDPVGRRYLKARIDRTGTRVSNRLSASILADGDRATFSVIQNDPPTGVRPCSSLVREDYELAKRSFSRRWEILESSEVRIIKN